MRIPHLLLLHMLSSKVLILHKINLKLARILHLLNPGIIQKILLQVGINMVIFTAKRMPTTTIMQARSKRTLSLKLAPQQRLFPWTRVCHLNRRN